MCFLGYNLQYKGYWCLDPVTNRVFISCHVMFDKITFPFQRSAAPTTSSTIVPILLEPSTTLGLSVSNPVASTTPALPRPTYTYLLLLMTLCPDQFRLRPAGHIPAWLNSVHLHLAHFLSLVLQAHHCSHILIRPRLLVPLINNPLLNNKPFPSVFPCL